MGVFIASSTRILTAGGWPMGEKLLKTSGGNCGNLMALACSGVRPWCSSKNVSGCGLPCSERLNASLFRPVTGLPLRSVTTTSTSTARLLTRRVVSGAEELSWAMRGAVQARMATIKENAERFTGSLLRLRQAYHRLNVPCDKVAKGTGRW